MEQLQCTAGCLFVSMLLSEAAELLVHGIREPSNTHCVLRPLKIAQRERGKDNGMGFFSFYILLSLSFFHI